MNIMTSSDASMLDWLKLGEYLVLLEIEMSFLHGSKHGGTTTIEYEPDTSASNIMNL